MDAASSNGTFTKTDYVILILLMVISFVIGSLAGLKRFKNSTTKDFLVAGRELHPIPVALSLTGGVVSALSVLGNPTETYLYGTQIWMILSGCLVGVFIVVFIFLPVLYPLDMVTIVEYLEKRYNSVLLRKMCSINQIINMNFYMGVCLYAPALALSSVTTIPIWICVVVLGVICSIYIAIGGVRGIVNTDVFQTGVIFIGVTTVVVLECVNLGGIKTVFQIADEGGRLEWFNLDTNPLIRHTFWSVQVFGVYWVVSVVCFSQAQFQRLVSVKSLKGAQSSCFMFFIGLSSLWSLFYLSGLVAYATYLNCDPLGSQKISEPDQIIPYLVADKLRHITGLSGLFVASVLAGVLSTVSSQANSFAAIIWEEFLSGWKSFMNCCTCSPVNVTRILSILGGLIGIGTAFLVAELGTLMQTAYSVNSALISPTDGLFVAGVLAPWVTEKGAICGFLAAVCLNVWLVVGKFMNGAGRPPKLPLSTSNCSETSQMLFANSSLYENNTSPSEQERDYLGIYDLSYCYVGPLAILVVLLVSTVVSYITGPNTPESIDASLVHKGCLQKYKKLFEKSKTNKNY